VRATSADQRKLLDLAEVDTALDRLNHRRRTLPELAEITEVEKGLRTKRDTVVRAETALGDSNREATRLETEIDQVRAREDRDRALVAGNTVTAKQVADLEHELNTLARRKGILEDELLEIMERREAEEAHLRHARGELTEAQERLADASARYGSALTDLEEAELRHREDRKRVVDSVPTDLIATYDRLRAQRGTGAALIRARRCGACRLELDRTFVSRLRSGAEDEVMRCDECGVILVRTPESGL
jgi:predicted  nucleic acid-binding Zn-ribbon protein